MIKAIKGHCGSMGGFASVASLPPVEPSYFVIDGLGNFVCAASTNDRGGLVLVLVETEMAAQRFTRDKAERLLITIADNGHNHFTAVDATP